MRRDLIIGVLGIAVVEIVLREYQHRVRPVEIRYLGYGLDGHAGIVATVTVDNLLLIPLLCRIDASKRNIEWFEGIAELEKAKALWSLLSCLCHPHDDVQIYTLRRSLKRIGDKRAVPFLLVYAQHMAIYEGGSENATLHGIIHQEIAKTLSALTGINIILKGQKKN